VGGGRWGWEGKGREKVDSCFLRAEGQGERGPECGAHALQVLGRPAGWLLAAGAIMAFTHSNPPAAAPSPPPDFIHSLFTRAFAFPRAPPPLPALNQQTTRCPTTAMWPRLTGWRTRCWPPT
jgi:hypothetical protein